MKAFPPNIGLKKFIPWILVLVLILGFDLLKVLPKTLDWVEMQSQVKTMDRDLKKDNMDLEELKQVLEQTQVQFDSESKDFVIEESQIFPEQFDAYQASKILEIFSIQYSLLRADSLLRIERLAFSGSGKPEKGESYIRTGLTLELQCSEDTLKNFVAYLQKSKLPTEFTDNSELDARDIEFLRSNKLPLAHIDSIRVSAASGSSTINEKIKRVALGITFFSQK